MIQYLKIIYEYIKGIINKIIGIFEKFTKKDDGVFMIDIEKTYNESLSEDISSYGDNEDRFIVGKGFDESCEIILVVNGVEITIKNEAIS